MGNRARGTRLRQGSGEGRARALARQMERTQGTAKGLRAGDLGSCTTRGKGGWGGGGGGGMK